MAAQSQQQSAHKSQPGTEESLTTLLNEDQRGELTLLIASAMATMRKTITSSFDADARLSQQLASLTLTSEDDKIMDENTDPAEADIPKIEQEKKVREQRQKELDSPQVKELKEASLKFYDDWRGKVIERVGEVVNSREKAIGQQRRAHAHSEQVPTHQDSKVDAGKAKSEETAQALFQKIYPPIPTPLASLEEKTRLLIIHSTLLLLLSLEHYIAPSRILLLYLSSSLKLPIDAFIEDEERVAKGLLEATKAMSGDEEAKKKVEENQSARKWKVGLASVAGAALIGVTGGLAAPLVAAGVGSVMGGLGLGATAAAGYLGSVAGSTVIVGGLFGAYGGRMTGQMMENYAREVEDFAFVPVSQSGDSNVASKESEASHRRDDEKAGHTDSQSRRLRVTIGITGWLTDPSQVDLPWRVISNATSEPFALRWELEALLNLGNSLDAMVSSAAWGYAKTEIISRTVFAGLAQAAAWPMTILSLSKVVDNPFSIARSRADKAGEVLADALINKAQGERPVTLIGYSLGARVIYACLTSLAKRKAFGLVESAVFIGAPCPSSTAEWRTMRTVVSGRLVNVYSDKDYVLRFLYRTSSMQYGVAGLTKVVGLPSVENVDVSQTVTGHLRYRYLVGSILSKIGFEDLDLEEVAKEEEAFTQLLREEEKHSYTDTAKEKGQKVLEDNPLGVGQHQKNTPKPGQEETKKSPEQQRKENEEAEREAQEMEKQVQAKTQKSLTSSLSGYLPVRLRGKEEAAAKKDPGASKDLAAKDEKVSAAMGEKKEEQGLLGSLTGGFLGGK